MHFNGCHFLYLTSLNFAVPCFHLLLSLQLTGFIYNFLLYFSPDRTIHPGLVLTSVYETRGCSDEPQQHIVYVEHVVVRVTITHSRRGDLSITLTSPSGTVSQLLANR